MRRSPSEIRERLSGLADRLHRLSPITDREHKAICGLWRDVFDLAARTPLPSQGDIGFIVSGWACHQRSAAGRRQIIAFLTPGDSHRPRRDLDEETTQAVCLTRVQFLDASALFDGDAAKEHPSLAQVLAECERRAREAMINNIVRLASRDGRGGLAHLILELEARTTVGETSAEDWFELPVGQRPLADAMGFSIVHMNHTLARLRDDGLLEVRPGRARVLDRAGLTALAAGEVSARRSGSPARR